MESEIDYRDPKWVASRLGLDKNTVYRLLQDGTLPAVQIGKKWLISETRLAELFGGADTTPDDPEADDGSAGNRTSA